MNTLTIRSRADLSRVRRLNRWFERPDVDGISIELYRLDPWTRRTLERGIARLFNECGCGLSSGVFGAAAIASFVVLRDPTISLPGQVGYALLLALIPAIATKAIVMAIAHIRLEATLRFVDQLIESGE